MAFAVAQSNAKIRHKYVYVRIARCLCRSYQHEKWSRGSDGVNTFYLCSITPYFVLLFINVSAYATLGTCTYSSSPLLAKYTFLYGRGVFELCRWVVWMNFSSHKELYG